MRFNYANKFCPNLNNIFLLVVGFFHATKGLKFFGNILVEIITLVALSLIFFNIKTKSLRGIEIPSFLKIYFISSIFTALMLLFFSIYDVDKSAFVVAYQLIIPLIYIYLVILSTQNVFNQETEDSGSLIKHYSYFIFGFALSNILMFILVNFFNIQPFFSIELGTIQPRIYEHFLIGVTAKADNMRYMSFFGEPSDFFWVMASGAFILLKYNYFFMASTVIFSMILSGSGSIAIFLPFLFFYCFLKKDYKVFWVAIASLVIVYFVSELTIYRLISRFYDLGSHKIFIGRLQRLAIENQNKAKYINNSISFEQDNLVNFFNFLLPTKIASGNLINYINNFFYIIFRIRIFALPFVFASIFIFYTQFKNFLISRNIDLMFSLGCFILLLFCREAFCFILVFWYLSYLTFLKVEREISHD